MSTETVERARAVDTHRPTVAHAWCTCYERDGIQPIPSLCGQSTKTRTPEVTSWPADMQACVLCAELAGVNTPCSRCGATA